jgi:hypothetical protein
MEKTPKTQQGLRFFWNGIKGSDGKLQSAIYSDGELLRYPAGTISIYAKSRFEGDVKTHFTVENDSDMMTDYFEPDRIRVAPSHPLYAQVKQACEARKAHYGQKQGAA